MNTNHAKRRFGARVLASLVVAACLSGMVALALAQSDSSHAGGRDSARAGGAPAGPGQAGGFGGPRGPQTPYVMPPLSTTLFSDLHNKLIHFPIVLNLVAVVMVFAARRKPVFEPVAFWLIWFALLSSLAAYFSGMAQSQEFQHRPKEWLVNTHMRFAIGLALAQCVWVLTWIRPRTRDFATFWSLVVAGLVLVTGHLGGLVAHGHGAAPPPQQTQAGPR